MNTTDKTGRAISNLSNLIRRRMDTVTTCVRGSQGRILHFLLAQSEDVFQRDIEEEFNLRPSSATGILKLMEKDGLIYRESIASDARLKRIITTDKANQLKQQVLQDVETLEHDLTKGISREDLDIFYQVTQQMKKNLSD